MISEAQARKYCYEDISKIENYQQAVADKEHIWHCHHRAEILPCGRYTVDQLQKHGLYWNRPSSELIFLRHDVHRNLHQTGNKYCCGRKVSDDTRRKMLDSNPNKKKVEMTRLSDGFTMTFASQKEATRWLRLNGHPKATNARVSDCANGHRATTYGAKWRIIHG